MENMTEKLRKKEQQIRDTAYGLNNQLETLNELDPVIAGKVFKSIIQYLHENNVTKTVFTIDELEQLNHI